MKVKIGSTEYRATLSPLPGNRSPLRANGTVEVIVNGSPTVAAYTSSVGFSAPGKSIEYPYFPKDGKFYYIALDYGVPASSLKGLEVTLSEGSASRPDPARVPKSKKAEAERIGKFKDTLAAKSKAAA
jgi:hypothetical protein